MEPFSSHTGHRLDVSSFYYVKITKVGASDTSRQYRSCPLVMCLCREGRRPDKLVPWYQGSLCQTLQKHIPLRTIFASHGTTFSDVKIYGFDDLTHLSWLITDLSELKFNSLVLLVQQFLSLD